jgi:hypothetical protein
MTMSKAAGSKLVFIFYFSMRKKLALLENEDYRVYRRESLVLVPLSDVASRYKFTHEMILFCTRSC